jgi:hypothetical protein
VHYLWRIEKRNLAWSVFIFPEISSYVKIFFWTVFSGEVEVFPGNVAAAQLIYRCLNALSTDGSPLQANVTGSATSEDGTTQTITIQIPTQQQETEDDETTPCFLAIQEEEEEGVDTGGITIPADPDPDIVPDGS